VGKDKKKKRAKKATKQLISPMQLPPLGSAATWQVCESSKALDWDADPSVTLEFDYFGTRYKGTAYPVGRVEP
jgi:hypothetical protein